MNAGKIEEVPEITKAEKLDILIRHSEHLIKLSEDIIEIRGELDFLVKAADKELDEAREHRKLLLMTVMHKIQDLTKATADDVSNLWWKGLKQQAKTFRKELDGYKEELDGLRIYTLSTLKEIKEPPIKKAERYTIK